MGRPRVSRPSLAMALRKAIGAACTARGLGSINQNSQLNATDPNA